MILRGWALAKDDDTARVAAARDQERDKRIAASLDATSQPATAPSR